MVVIHRNGAERLLAALKSIESAIDLSSDEIIIVDNHSTDDSLSQAIAAFPKTLIIQNECNAGYARACNQGIKLARGQFIVLCNNDLVLPSDIIMHLVADFRAHPTTGLFGGQLLKSDGKISRSGGPISGFLSEMGIRFYRKAVFIGNQPIKTGSIVGACMAVRREAIEQAGPLDEDFFFYYEESEWCVRLQQHGWSIMIDPRIRIMHIGGASTRAYFAGARIEFFRSRLLYWKKTLPVTANCILIAWHIPRLFLDFSIYALATALTLGLVTKFRHKLMDRGVLISWLLRGRPEAWGLPDKCQK